jgi:hypothetical protein
MGKLLTVIHGGEKPRGGKIAGGRSEVCLLCLLICPDALPPCWASAADCCCHALRHAVERSSGSINAATVPQPEVQPHGPCTGPAAVNWEVRAWSMMPCPACLPIPPWAWPVAGVRGSTWKGTARPGGKTPSVTPVAADPPSCL